jgi:hypothetical protein
MYAAVALASALSVVVVSSLTGGMHWVTPPRVQVERVTGELRPTAAGAPPAAASSVAEAPSAQRGGGELDDVSATPDGEAVPAGLARPAYEAEPSAPAGSAGPVRTFVSGSDSEARPPQRKSRARRHARARSAREVHPATPAPAEKTSEARPARVRLVQDNLVTNRAPAKAEARTLDLPVRDSKAVGREGPGDPRARPAPAKSAELPDWLEAIKHGSSGR